MPTLIYSGEAERVDGKLFNQLVNSWLSWQKNEPSRNLHTIEWWAESNDETTGQVASVEVEIETDDSTAAISALNQFVSDLENSKGASFPEVGGRNIDIR